MDHTVSISTAQFGCFACNFTGLKIVHRQGDSASPPLPGSTGTNFYYASTVYVTCDCCITYSMPYLPPDHPGLSTWPGTPGLPLTLEPPGLPCWREDYNPHIIPQTTPPWPQPPAWLP